MARDYSALTGADLLEGIRKTHRIRTALDVLAILAVAGFLIGCVFLIKLNLHNTTDIIFGVIGIALCVLVLWVIFGKISEHVRTAAAPEKSRLFRKYGTPDEIAARIAAEYSEPLFAEKSTLICRSFILNQNDFESFIPLDRTLLVYRKESSTNGIKHNVYLVVHDAFGDSFEYPFKLGKKHKQVMTEAMQEISRQSPQCAVGYSPANLSYVKKNAKTPE